MLTIRINDFAVQMRLGVFAEEREEPQSVVLSLRLELKNAIEPKQTEDLGQTLDYGLVMGCVFELVADREFLLIETVVNLIGHAIMDSFSEVQRVHVVAEKRKIPLSFADGVRVSVEQWFTRDEEMSV